MAAIEQIKESVTKLYKFRDEYFKTYGIKDAANKTQRVQQEVNKTIQLIDNIRDQVSPDSKGELYFLHGRALNATAEYSAEAEEVLGRATRFNLPDAWNELGECQYKKGDLSGAYTCFEKALKLAQNKVYHRNMSMLMRSLPWKTTTEREENVEKANDPLAVVLPELHFSRFHVQWYEEDYAGALGSLQRAYELEPTWTECKTKFDECYKFLTKLSQMVKNKGHLNQRRLNVLTTDINTTQLGPYEKAGTNLTGGKKPDLIPVSLLGEGNNQDRVILGKVVSTVIPESGIPFSMCLVDKEGSCIAVTVYNWASGYGVKIGDSVAIIAPVLKTHRIEIPAEETLSFRSVRVAVPLMLVVNKRPVGINQIATSQIVSQQKPE
ncbi:tetratricopeptide repeat protein 5-like isoform X3 [Panulirus ornatus]|uniref:tetratricopeptide repeat protein 5-like isoform X3 n=1 Tax=Panulirus ornatus TaxID=150431 RepID=UPI003A838CDF